MPMNRYDEFCCMTGRAKITEITGKSNAEFLKNAQLGDEIEFSMKLDYEMFPQNISHYYINCLNLRTGGKSKYTPNQLNRTLTYFKLEMINEK